VPGEASLTVHDALGRRVRTVAGGAMAAGTHEVAWDGRTDAGAPVAAGVYVVRLLAAGRTVSRTFARVR
jgi:flagellar hook assembly protein FlgD